MSLIAQAFGSLASALAPVGQALTFTILAPLTLATKTLHALIATFGTLKKAVAGEIRFADFSAEAKKALRELENPAKKPRKTADDLAVGQSSYNSLEEFGRRIRLGAFQSGNAAAKSQEQAANDTARHTERTATSTVQLVGLMQQAIGIWQMNPNLVASGRAMRGF